MSSSALSADHVFINMVRVRIGLKPLHTRGEQSVLPEGAHTYIRLEMFRRLADQNCGRCGGSGYYDGEHLEMRCPCTGMPPRVRRGSLQGQSIRVISNGKPSFAAPRGVRS